MEKLTAALLAIIFLSGNSLVYAQSSLAGSRAAMELQHRHAVSSGYSFAQTSRDVTSMIEAGELLRVHPTSSLVLHNISYPYLRPAVKTLLERLSVQYQNACGEQLTATSMTRPIARQPANAHRDSVHPTGMAFDLRIPQNSRCRAWLERTLLTLEDREVLNVIRERNPPHYHVAVFPEPYQIYLAGMTGQSHEYVVRRGDTLSGIAARTGTTVAQLRAANGLRGDLLRIGQKVMIPGGTPRAPDNSNGASVIQVSAQSAEPTRREVTHKVQQGETLWRIARRYSTTVDVVRTQNGLADDLLRVGQMLRIVIEDI